MEGVRYLYFLATVKFTSSLSLLCFAIFHLFICNCFIQAYGQFIDACDSREFLLQYKSLPIITGILSKLPTADWFLAYPTSYSKSSFGYSVTTE